MADDDVNRSPMISVVMPAYNAQEFIAEAIDSVLAQSFTDFEFIIINDGSVDDTLAIINSYDDKRIRLIDNEKNLGITGSLNKGLNAAAGLYIARMDADDVCIVDRFAKQILYLESHPAVNVLGTAVCDIDVQGKALGAFSPPSTPAVLGFVILYRFPFYHPSLMLRAKVLKEHALQYEDRFGKGVEDFDFINRIAEHGDLANLDEVLLLFRQHEGSVTASNQERQVQNLQKVTLFNIQKWLGVDVNFGRGDIAEDVDVFDRLLTAYITKRGIKEPCFELRSMIGRYVVRHVVKKRQFNVLLRLLCDRKYGFWPFVVLLPSFLLKRVFNGFRMRSKVRVK